MNSYNERIDILLSRIDRITLSKELLIPSLYIGDLGRVIYFSYRYLQTQEKEYSEACQSLLEELINNSNNYFLDSSLGTGLTGYCWTIQHLIDLGLLKPKEITTVEDILPYLLNSIKQDFKRKDYDFIYGCLGKISCLSLLSPTKNIKNSTVLAFLDKIKEKDGKGIFWRDVDRNDDVNLGIAHGMPSILLFLIDHYGKNRQVFNSFIEPGISWLLAQRKKSGISSFPHCTLDAETDSRLAWCYGDLGISYLLLKAGNLYNNVEWYRFGYFVAQKASYRNINNSGVYLNGDNYYYDTCFCHGTSGVAYLFSALAEITNEPIIIKAKNNWLNINLENSEKHIDNFENLPKQDLTKEGELDSAFCQNIGLLEGVIGTALVLMHSTNNNLNGWSKLFQIQ
ncbi:MAG: lanthionine synthetase LanC family protein [Nitrososphaeraceae archaeon]